MADIKKCDICGTVYEGGEHPVISGVMSSSVTVSDYGNYSDLSKRTYDRYETCPNCTTQIRKFIMNLKIQSGLETVLKNQDARKCRWCR